MSKPTAHDVAYRWYNQAMADRAVGIEVEVPEEPQCGWYMRRLVKGGPHVPARIWYESETDADGELTGDEVMRCEVNNKYEDPEEQWLWLAGKPILPVEYDYLTAVRNYAVAHAPDEPLANPRRPIDWAKTELPIFNRRKE